MDYDRAEHRKNWRLNWLSSLNELTNSVDQKRWLDKRIRNPHWTYTEFMCCYFDDLDLTSGYDIALETGFVSQDEFKAVEIFHMALRSYKPPNGPDDGYAILNDKKWNYIVELGQAAVKKLEALITNIDEKKVLTEAPPELTIADFTWGLKKPVPSDD